MAVARLKDRGDFSENFLQSPLAVGLIEQTLPDSPNSPTENIN